MSESDTVNYENRIDATTVLSESDEREIAYRCGILSESQQRVADDFDVSQSTVSNVVREFASFRGKELELEILDEFDIEDYT